jgi:hypothetical protein
MSVITSGIGSASDVRGVGEGVALGALLLGAVVLVGLGRRVLDAGAALIVGDVGEDVGEEAVVVDPSGGSANR